MTKTATCRRCRATLTSARSVARRIGNRCLRLERAEATARAKAVAGVKPEMVAKAHELIEDGAIIPLRGHRVFQAVASNGVDLYLVASQACNCQAGLKGRTCYHKVAARILALAA